MEYRKCFAELGRYGLQYFGYLGFRRDALFVGMKTIIPATTLMGSRSEVPASSMKI